MIKNQKRTTSAEDDYIITDVTYTTPTNSNTPTNTTNKDLILTIQKRNFWKEEKQTDTSNTQITIPLSDYALRKHLEDNYYNKTSIDNLVTKYKIKVSVLNSTDDLPDEADLPDDDSITSYLFFVRHTHSTPSEDQKDYYDEYIWDTERQDWERIGNTDIDLSAYLKIADFNTWKTNVYDVFTSNMNTTISGIQSDITDLQTNKAPKTLASASNNGLMSSSDFSKLENIEAQATKNTVESSIFPYVNGNGTNAVNSDAIWDVLGEIYRLNNHKKLGYNQLELVMWPFPDFKFIPTKAYNKDNTLKYSISIPSRNSNYVNLYDLRESIAFITGQRAGSFNILPVIFANVDVKYNNSNEWELKTPFPNPLQYSIGFLIYNDSETYQNNLSNFRYITLLNSSDEMGTGFATESYVDNKIQTVSDVQLAILSILNGD